MRLPTALAALLGLAYAGSLFPGPFAVLDNLSNFPAHFAAAFLALGAFSAARRRAAAALGSLALAALPLAQVLPWYFGAGEDQAGPAAPPVELLVSNVHYANGQRERLLRLVDEENPDVVGLVEVTSGWLGGLAPLRERYAHRYEVPDELYAGLALYSRLPLKEARVLDLPGESSRPAIAATLAAPGGDVEIVLAHPMPPISVDHIRQRNAQIAALARHARSSELPLVLAGDLNLTMWNGAYRQLAETAGLENARKGRCICATWPAIGPLGVPIDHVLASPGVRLRDFRVLRGIGSDHLPVAAEFTLR